MTKQEFDEMAALVVRLRKDVELHTDALRQSNAHCGKLLVQNEQLQSQLTSVTKELEYARKAINALDQIDKNITDASALYGRRAGETVSAFIERMASVRDQFHRELVNVRAALTSAIEQRDSCRRTLYEWEHADTKPHERVAADDVADHVVPPVLNRGEPDPVNDARDARLEYRHRVPTPEMIAVCKWWDVAGSNMSICFKNEDQRPVVWRYAGNRGDGCWEYTECPQPLKPHGMTYQELDARVQSSIQMCCACLAGSKHFGLPPLPEACAAALNYKATYRTRQEASHE